MSTQSVPKGLRVTPARLALLRAVADGRVLWWPSYGGRVSWVEMFFTSSAASRAVTRRAAELSGAGWIALAGVAPGRSAYAARRYELTDAGRAVLDANPRKAVSVDV